MARAGLAAKALAPAPAGLVRERLLRLADARVIMIVAPAGHGKTTLLAHAASEFVGRVAWYRLDAYDRAPEAFRQQVLPRVLAALADSGSRPPPGPPVEGEEQGGDPVAEADRAAAAIERVIGDGPALLVLDDLHEVAGSDTEEVLLRLVTRVPAGLTVLIAGRHLPGVHLPSLRLCSSIRVIDADDLRFRSWEVERLFRDVYAAPLPPEDAATLTVRTDGWAAGLTMFHLLTSGRPPAHRRATLDGLSRGLRVVRSYLVREVLDDLPSELRDFLRRTSALGVLTGRLCDRLLEREGSAAVLEDLEQRQLFTIAQDDGVHFRYHQVLQDHLELELREQLGAVEARAWYLRVAQLLEQENEPRAAFRAYALAEHWQGLERLLHERGQEVVAAPLGELAELLPADLTEHDPWLLLATARRLMARGAVERALAAYRSAEARAVDPDVAELCRLERRRASLWAAGADPSPREWQGAVRAGTRRFPARLQAEARRLPGPGGRLASGWLALMSGDPRTATTLFQEAAGHPHADPDVLRVAGLGRAAAAFLDPGLGDVDAVSAAESLAVDAELAGQVSHARMGRALAAAAGGDSTQLELLAEEAERDCDEWGVALIRLAGAIADRDVESAVAAASRFSDLDAPVMAHWATCLAQVIAGEPGGPAGSGPAAPVRLGRLGSVPTVTGSLEVLMADVLPPEQVQQDGRALGVRDGPAVMAGWLRSRDGDGARPGLSRVPAGRPAPAEDVEPALATEQPVRMTLLGGFSIVVGGRPVDIADVRPRVRTVLRFLALRAGSPVHRDAVVSALWPDVEPEAGYRSLQVAVSTLRHLLEPDMPRGQSTLLPRLDDTYRLALPPGSRCDVVDFEDGLRHAERCHRAGDGDGEVDALRSALAAYAGDLLPEEGTAEWVLSERDRLRLAAADAAERLARARAVQEGGHDAGTTSPAWRDAVVAVRRSLTLDPYRDGAWRLLIDLHERAGDLAAAEAARQQRRRRLAELGLDR